ncbi:DMT family transporter [Salinibacterium hongtaonis]|uniref:DMT family transporter n=1 Tax=Homoserinimonas hongtaonis TaxID=2079791 RepID=UPI0018EE661E|nr:EamA family transporter [Salinibacterium hongtaonis]
MENKLRWVLLTAVAPISWGTTYYLTYLYLPADAPLWGAIIRALPAGLVLLAIRPRLPRGVWWWRAGVLGVLNMGTFFALVYVAAQLLPSSIATTVMATSPLFLMVLAWPMIRERPQILQLTGAVLGIAGVALMVLTGASGINLAGVAASLSAIAISSVGHILAKKWTTDIDVISVTSWQLIAGGLVLLPVAGFIEGAPPALDLPAILTFAYLSIVATALAYAAWFTGLKHLTAGTVGLIGLLNPVVGVLLGVIVAGDILELRQLLGLVLVVVGILLGQPIVKQLLGARQKRLQRGAEGEPQGIRDGSGTKTDG